MNDIKTDKLGSLCHVLAGGTPSRSNPAFWGGGVPWVKISDMLQGHIRQTDESISQEGLENSAARLLPKGTLLLSIFATIGRTAVLEIEAATNQAIVGLIPKRSDEVDNGYLRRYLEAQVSSLVRQGRGGAQSNINGAILKDLDIPLPALNEQKRIAAVLDKANALRTARQDSLQLIEKLRHAVFFEMFGEPEANPLGWPQTTMGKILCDGPQNGLYRPRTDYGTGRRILRIDGFYDGKMGNEENLKRLRLTTEEEQPYLLREGDIVINRVNSLEYLGKSAVIPKLAEPTVFESNMMRMGIDQRRFAPRFLIALLQTRYLKNQISQRAKKAVNQASVNQADIRSLLIFEPPLALQNDYLRRLEKIDSLGEYFASQALIADKLFVSLQQYAFHGELDLSKLFLEEDVEAIEQAADRLHNLVHVKLPKLMRGQRVSKALFPPTAIAQELRELDRRVEKGESIPWSPDYFKYCILGRQTAPLSFTDLLSKTESVFAEQPPYEEIKTLIFGLLRADNGQPLLIQKFDDKRREIVLQTAS